MIGRTIEELEHGDAAELQRQMTREVVRGFVASTGDDNPIHADPAFAATTRFGQVIAPGILTGGLLSAVIGTRLPGPGTIYLSQTFQFLKPVLLGDTITARVVVVELARERNRARLTTTCTNQGGELVLDGEAWVMPSRRRVEYRRPESRTGGLAGPLSPFAGPALAFELMAFWMTGGASLAGHALKALTAPRVPPGEADPVRP